MHHALQRQERGKRNEIVLELYRYIERLALKTIYFSKPLHMHNLVIGLSANR
jgi:IS1 family transposase